MGNINESMLREITLFNNLSAADLTILKNYLNLVEIGKGAMILTEGAPGDFACFIIKGTLEVIKSSRKGTEKTIGILSTGDFFGEMAIVDELSRSATVKARTDAVLMMLTQGNFNLLLKENPHIGTEILKEISRNLSLRLRRVSSNFVDNL